MSATEVGDSSAPAQRVSDDSETEKLLSFDALHAAEQITGASYKDDKGTMALGFSLLQAASAEKERVLAAADDTSMRTPFTRTLEIYLSEGFTVVYKTKFPSIGPGGGEDAWLILWHPEGLLATLESYGPATNSSKIYFNVKAPESGRSLLWSGCYSRGHFVGDMDVREGLRHRLRQLRELGTARPWVERPFLWLLTYNDSKVDGYDHNALNEQRIAQLPADVQAAIRGRSRPGPDRG